MENKVYVITGSTGIAAATIKFLCMRGAKLFFIGRTHANCEKLEQEIKAMGYVSHFIVGDLTDPDVADRLITACVEKYGRIDGLFNVAGISGRKYGDGPLHECTEEGWEVTMNTNVTTQYRMCHKMIKLMLKQEPEDGQRGSILNMASVLALAPEPRHFSAVAYAAGKGAIISMSRTAAAYYAPHKIRINVIAPALVCTSMSARASENKTIVEWIEKKQPLTGGMIDVEEVAAAAGFLLGSSSRAITGEVLKVDGGWGIS